MTNTTNNDNTALSRQQLLALTEKLPEAKIGTAAHFLQALVDDKEPAKVDNSLHQLLLTVVSTLTNTLYDLSAEATRNESKAYAKRLEHSRKKIMESWEGYNENH